MIITIFRLVCLVPFWFVHIESFSSIAEEREFIDSLLSNATKHSPHSNMANNTVYFYVDVYQVRVFFVILLKFIRTSNEHFASICNYISNMHFAANTFNQSDSRISIQFSK